MGSLVGQSLGRYEILEEIGEGGMAVVYRANDSRLDRDVAIKVIRKGAFPADHIDRILKRFEREAKALARLSHPNIMKVHDYGEHEGSPYLVMEYLPGGTLKQKMGKPMPWEQALRLILPIAEALDYAHSQNMIHRDVKPSNILLTQRGQPLLTDFGIAKILEVEEGQTLTGTGMGVGTPEYMSPEQWKGKSSPRSDIYSLGVVLYELLAGRKPYLADTPADLLLKQATEPLPRLSMFAKGLPPNAEKNLFKALERKPEDRFVSMSEFASALESLQKGEPVPAPKRQMEDSQATFDQFELRKPRVAKTQNRTQTLTLPGFKQGGGFQTPVLLALGLGAAGLLCIGIIIATAYGWFPNLFSTLPSASTSTLPPASTPTLPFTDPPLPTSDYDPTLTPWPTQSAVPPTLVSNTPVSTPLPTEITDSKGITMRIVSAGEFTMGNDADVAQADCLKYRSYCYRYWFQDADPPHQVYLDAFYMDIYEVTNAAYEVCVTAGVCDPPKSKGSYTRTSYYGDSQYDNYPVIYVDWNKAKTYCEWREAGLPTEAQWEKAARGDDGRAYPWGEGISCSQANSHDGNKYCIGDTSEVGSYESGKSPYGMYDMAGNVWEWVADWYAFDYYARSLSSNPLGPDSGKYRVLRGGSWEGSFGVNVRSAYRYRDTPDGIYYGIGFRCARSLP